MAKLSKQQSNLHLQSMDLVNSDKELTTDEKQFVLNNYNPNATNLTTISGAFFTPESIAQQFAIFSDPKGNIIELCAGIGSLSYWLLEYDQFSGRRPSGWMSAEIENLTCVEINPEYVTVGKKIIPGANWILGSVLNESLIKQIQFGDCVIANPPFGAIRSDEDRTWIRYNMKAYFDLNVVAIGTQIANAGCFILPKGRTSYDMDKHEHITNELHDNFKKATGFMLELGSWDLKEFQNDWIGAKPIVEFVTFEKI